MYEVGIEHEKEETMGKMRIVEDSPVKFVLEKSLTARDIWNGWGKYFVNPLVFLALSYAGLYVLRPPNTLSFTWLYWVIGVGVGIVEIFAIYAVLYIQRNITITFDLQSRVATRAITFVSGKRQKTEAAFEQVGRIVLHDFTEIREPRLELDTANQSDFIIATYFDLHADKSPDESIIESLESLGKKIGQVLQRPLVRKITEVDVDETLLSEEVIQP